MKELQHLLNKLQSNISTLNKVNLEVSGGSVGWHIEHSLKTIDQIVNACKNSNPSKYQWHFNFNRFLILSITKKIPRGKAKAPKVVRPEGEISKESLQLHLEKVSQNLENWNGLDKNVHFPHPFFGILNKKETEKFLVLHTNHHLQIIEDICN